MIELVDEKQAGAKDHQHVPYRVVESLLFEINSVDPVKWHGVAMCNYGGIRNVVDVCGAFRFAPLQCVNELIAGIKPEQHLLFLQQ